MEIALGFLVVLIMLVTIGRGFFKSYQAKKDRELLQTTTTVESGTASERQLVLNLLKFGVSPQAIWHDLYLEKPNGEFSQIDAVVATKSGIIVFEDKCYGGWIFGNGNQDRWTQVMGFGNEKYQFYNPIKQNAHHIDFLRKGLNETVPFYSVIVFNGNCKLKEISNIPDKTFIVYPQQVLQIVNKIQNGEPANYKNKQRVVAVLNKAVENGKDTTIRNSHINNIHSFRNRP
jgi:hypothetical protein